MRRYNPKELEPKWRKIWDEQQLYQADLESSKPKYIAMSMFNYPSGAGIHIGHAMNYTISDVMARFKRQQGYESYHPVGWDSFGLPAENYAIKAGVSPQASMAKIIPDYHTQYKAMGWSNDWSKEIATHEPEYYKWTQWIFAEMYRQGLAYQDSRMQWWCEKCQTVLANEQIVDGKCWRHDGADDPVVEKKEVKQWFFKITDYADELLDAIDDLDWPNSIKLAQKNWIGRSKGAEINFEVDEQQGTLTVFTTRPDTLFGATFLVLAPEHPLSVQIAKDSQIDEVKDYIKAAVRKSDVERQSGDKDKTGVSTGAYAINPVNQAKIPIWIADYVLPGYGTGAIMAVPAHDERDYEFAKKYSLEIIRVVKNEASDDECSHDEGIMINSGGYDGVPSQEAREKIVLDLAKSGVATEKTQYKILDWSVSRQRYWGAPIPVINCGKCGNVLVPDDQLPVVLPELDDFKPSGDGRSALARAKDWLNVDCPQCGGPAERETDTLDTYICSSWYMLRYLDPHNSKEPFDKFRASHWMPIDFYNGADHATAHMIYARFVTRFFHKLGLVNDPEPFKKFLFNGKLVAQDGKNFSKTLGNGPDPLEIIAQGYGADALRTYLMFAAPLDLWVRWDPRGVPGCHRFLNRLWTLVQEYLEVEADGPENTQILSVIHRTIQKVSHDIEDQKYNTAISAMMACVNEFYKLKEVDGYKSVSWKFGLESLVQLVAPFAPHMADELWSQLGNQTSVNVDNWPTHDPKYLVDDEVTIVVQVNGKVRAELKVSRDITQDEMLDLAKAEPNVQNHTDGKEIKKVIFIPGKILNLVV